VEKVSLSRTQPEPDKVHKIFIDGSSYAQGSLSLPGLGRAKHPNPSLIYLATQDIM
jgi:hypothetical protein